MKRLTASEMFQERERLLESAKQKVLTMTRKQLRNFLRQRHADKAIDAGVFTEEQAKT